MRESLSAADDGEVPPLTARQVDTHLQSCAGCRQWRRAVPQVDRRVRIGGPLPPPDLMSQVLDAVATDVRRRRSRHLWAVVTVLVALSGLVQLAVSLPLLAMRGHAWEGHWIGVLQGLAAAGFLMGTLVLLWHSRQPAERVGLLQPHVAEYSRSADRPGEVA